MSTVTRLVIHANKLSAFYSRTSLVTLTSLATPGTPAQRSRTSPRDRAGRRYCDEGDHARPAGGGRGANSAKLSSAADVAYLSGGEHLPGSIRTPRSGTCPLVCASSGGLVQHRRRDTCPPRQLGGCRRRPMPFWLQHNDQATRREDDERANRPRGQVMSSPGTRCFTCDDRRREGFMIMKFPDAGAPRDSHEHRG